MDDVGLTHGGFYAHFDGKDQLIADAVRYATDATGDGLESRIEHLAGREWVEAWVDLYLSDGHCEQPEGGCILPSLMAELSRTPGVALQAFRESLERRLDRIAGKFPFPRAEAKRRVMSAYAHMAGALMIARGLEPEASSTLRRDVAASVKATLLGEPMAANIFRRKRPR